MRQTTVSKCCNHGRRLLTIITDNQTHKERTFVTRHRCSRSRQCCANVVCAQRQHRTISITFAYITESKCSHDVSVRQSVLLTCFKPQTITRNPDYFAGPTIAQSSARQSICINDEPLAFYLQHCLHATVAPLRVFHHLCRTQKWTQLRLFQLVPGMSTQQHTRDCETKQCRCEEANFSANCTNNNQYNNQYNTDQHVDL